MATAIWVLCVFLTFFTGLIIGSCLGPKAHRPTDNGAGVGCIGFFLTLAVLVTLVVVIITGGGN